MRPRGKLAQTLLTAALLSVLFFASALPPAASALAPTDGSGGEPVSPLRLKAAHFDPLVQGTSWIPSGFRLAALNPFADLYVVQFKDKVVKGQREAMLETGAGYHSYLPDNAFLVQASSTQIAAVRALDFVRVVIPWEPYLRIAPELQTPLWRSDSGPAIVMAESFAGDERLVAFASARGATVLERDGPFTTLSIPRSLLVGIASLPTVTWVENWEPREIDNRNSAVIQGARQNTDGAFSGASLRLWSFNPATGLFEGTTGKDVVVAVSDTGLDVSHPGFAGKIVLFDNMGNPGTQTSGSHGTHTAGTVLGSGAWRAADAGIAVPGKYAGIAPEAKLVVENIFGASPSNTQAGVDNAVGGAVISSNSWSSGGSYDGDARLYDRMARDSWTDGANVSSLGPQPVLYFFSAGNAGGTGNAHRIASPSQGKNVISVGATGDENPLSMHDMAGFSSRGPADDERIKPDLVAPGEDVMSAMALGGGFSNPQGTSYGEASGTSMSCPGAAGAAAVAWQFYKDRIGVDPSPDMMKAILINGADEMDGSRYPVLGPDQGFGRINLSTSLLTLSARQQIWMDRPAALSTGEEMVLTYPIADSLTPFVITLAWLDEPGDAGASPALVNDLDLYVVGPNGDRFYGNKMDANGDSQKGTVADRLNSVEKVKFAAPSPGYYEVHINGSNVPVGPQDFSLAIRGNVATDWYDLLVEKVTTNATNPIEGNSVTFNATLWNRGTQWVNGSAVDLEANTAQGVSPVGSFNPGSIAPGARFDVTTTWTTVRGNVTFVARASVPVGQLEFSATNNQANRSFFVRGYGYTLSTDAPTAYAVDPGTTLSLDFNVTQTGNVADNISIGLTSDSPIFGAFFDYSRLTVGPGQSKHFHLTVLVPLSAKAQERMNFTVFTRSLTDARVAQAFSTFVIVNHLHGFGFALAPNSALMPPTASMGSTIAVENLGNGPETINIQTIGVPGGWTFDVAPSAITLLDNETGTLSVSIRAPDRVDAGSEYVVGLRAYLSSNGAPPRLLNFTVTVTQVYGWSASAVGPASEVAAGSGVEIPISAQNYGNGVDEVNIDLTTPPGWAWGLTRTRLGLLPYGNLTSMARITVDPWAVAGDYSVRLTFGGSRNYTTQTVAVRVKMNYHLEIDGPGATIQMGQGEVNTFEVTVVNEGNGAATVAPVILAPQGVSLIPVVPNAVLERNSTAKFTFQVIVARDAGTGLKDLTLDFRSGENGSISYPLGMHIQINEVVEPVPTGENPTSTGGEGLIQALIGIVVVVGAAVPVGYIYLRRKAVGAAPPTEVIVQTVEDANSGSTYDPTRGYTPSAVGAPAAAQAAHRAPRAPRGAPTGASSAMTLVGVCKNCGGGVMDLGNGMGRCVSCGVEQIVRATKR